MKIARVVRTAGIAFTPDGYRMTARRRVADSVPANICT